MDRMNVVMSKDSRDAKQQDDTRAIPMAFAVFVLIGVLWISLFFGILQPWLSTGH